MDQNINGQYIPVLELAWRRHAEFDENASKASNRYLRMRDWVIILGVIATLLAVLIDTFYWQPFPEPGVGGRVLRVTLILVPIISSVILAFASKFQQGERWLALRTGAEEIKKEVYLYRTLLQGEADRQTWLNDRLGDIQRRVYEAVGGGLVLDPYTGPIPRERAAADKQREDAGFDDLLPDEYIRYRLDDQLEWHTNKAAKLQTQRTWLQIGIFFFGGLGTFLAGLANIEGFGRLSIWVALTTALAAALTSWTELRRMDQTITNYSQLILELKIIRDHWYSLAAAERTGDEFFKLVIATEKVIWSQHNQFTAEMRKAVAELRGESDDTLDRVASMPAPAAIDRAIINKVQAKADTLSEKTPPATDGDEEIIAEQPAEPASTSQNSKRGLPHAFVVMPFGRKKGPDGRWIDFNSIYQDLIKPALEEAGFQSFRADEESVSGDILTDMFQELLLADLVVCDLSIDNANVFYELGVRHAFRKRGVIHIQSGRSYMPFDIFNVRTIPYICGESGKPDPHHLEKDKQAIIKVIRETWASDQARIHSPIFNLLDGLTEPDRKTLQTPLATGYWREHREWEQRVTIARRRKRIGDVLLLTEEVSNPLIQEDAIDEAGQALKNIGSHALALQQYQRGLELNPGNRRFRREEAFHLGRLRRYDEAIVKLERLLQDDPTDIEAVSYLGRIYKEMWQNEWESIDDTQTKVKEAYEMAYLLKKAIHTYLAGYSLNQNHYYSGINALVLSVMLDHLARVCEAESDLDPEVEAIRQQFPLLKGAVQFSLEKAADQEPNNFWVFASLGDLAVCTAEQPKAVKRAYKKALAMGGKSKFALQSTIAQLKLLGSLAFRAEFVAAGVAVLEEAIKKAYETEEMETARPDYIPAQVFLFSGHMIDDPQRPKPRFPPDMEAEARQKIEQTLDRRNANSYDLAVTAGAACGGDILFIEACLKREMRVEVYLPFQEAKFVEESVSFAGGDWVERFHAIRLHPNVTFHIQPDRLGPVPQDENAFARNNRWALYSALIYGIERIRLIVLWNGQGGDGPGGTRHMVQEVRRLGGIAEHLDTTKFDYWKAKGKVGQVLDKLIMDE
jgi:tetratricopeptide (TPR) repeat protein